MLEQKLRTHQNFKTYFLLEFTKELIRNTKAYKNLIIKKKAKGFIPEKKETKEEQEIETKENRNWGQEQKGVVQEIVKEKMEQDSQRLLNLKKRSAEIDQFREINPFESFFKQRKRSIGGIPSLFQVLESRLPPTVQHLRPVPMRMEINLKKLTPLIKDPFVRIIECNGPGEKIVVMGTMGRKKTGIILSKEETDEIIKIFSEATRIPLREGINKVVFGNLILSAINSEIISSKFIIKKMAGPSISFR